MCYLSKRILTLYLEKFRRKCEVRYITIIEVYKTLMHAISIVLVVVSTFFSTSRMCLYDTEMDWSGED